MSDEQPLRLVCGFNCGYSRPWSTPAPDPSGPEVTVDPSDELILCPDCEKAPLMITRRPL